MSVVHATMEVSKKGKLMSKIEMTNGTVVLSFDTWEEWDNAIAGVAGFFLPAEEEEECGRCGEYVLPSQHPSIGCDA